MTLKSYMKKLQCFILQDKNKTLLKMFLTPHRTNYFMPYQFRNSICYDNPVTFLPVAGPHHNPGNNAYFVFQVCCTQMAFSYIPYTILLSCNFKDASQTGDHSHGLVPRSRSAGVFVSFVVHCYCMVAVRYSLLT